MEKEKDNYYRFICVIYEVGGDVQRCRLKRSYISSNFQTLSHFLNEPDVLHTLFHLFFPTHLCCWKGCCKTQRAKGFSTNQWDILYDADPSLCCKQNEKICICCVTAKNVSESDLEISLLSLILNNCCNLTPNEKNAVQSLRDMKNNYISHPTNMSLSNSDFQSLWCQVEHHIKHLDSTNTYLYQQQILLHRPMDVSLVQKYFNNCFDASAQLDSKMKDLHAIIAGGEERVIGAIYDNFSQVNRKQEHILKSLQKLQSTKEYKQSESNNVGDCITTKRKRHDPAVCLDVSDEEENINADTYVSKKRKQQKLERFNLLKGQIDDLRYKTPDTKPLDESKEYISSTLIGSKLPTAVSLQMDYKVCTMKDLTKQQGFKKADKYICGECDWLTISLDEFLKHKQQCIMRQKENEHVKHEYKKYVVARITVPTKDKDLSSKIEKEWQQGNINPQHSSIEVTYITTGCVVIWVKVDLLLFLNISKFYSALDTLVYDIFQKYAVNLPKYSVEVYDIATGYVDNSADKFSCGDCKQTCITLDNFISHKKTRCFQHVLPEKLFSSASFLSGCIPQNSGLKKNGPSLLTLNNCCADFVESPLAKDCDKKDSSACVEETDIHCGLSRTPVDLSRKHSAIVSEVEIKMSSECSDMLKKNKGRFKSRDIEYSSHCGNYVCSINTGSISIVYDCGHICYLTKNVDTLGAKISTGENKSPKRERRSPVTLSYEEVNFLRSTMLLTEVSTRAVRTFFERDFAPEYLEYSPMKEYKEMLDLKKKHRINQLQWDLMFPRFPYVTDSKTLNVNLMMILLKNLTQMNPPSCGFDHLPSAIETTQAADLSRLKYYRNYLSHYDDGKVDNTFFNMAWNDLTSEYIEDLFGRKLENDMESIRNVELKKEHPRSSKGSARRDIKEKTVAFEIYDGQSKNSDILMVENEDEWKARRDSSSINRELLRKRLFKNKRKSRSHGGADNRMFMSDDGRPRELSDLVRGIPQNSANKYLLNDRAPIPGSVVSRNYSMKNKFYHDQQPMYREGLATDKKILEHSSSLKRPLGVSWLAFPDDIRVSIDNEENENVTRMENGINIGSDDELFLVGDNREQQPEQFFTHIRRPGQTTVRPLPANNVKPDMDDRRLRKFLEELYKDKKYFDHVIETTEPNTEPIIDERDLAEHGRGFLLERAEYWDGIGIPIPRPPTTAVGLRLSRINTNLPDSGRVYNIACASTVTSTPHPEQRQETPKQSKETFV